MDEAERSDVIAELRGAEIGRLEMLVEALAPTLAEVPADIDLFDVAVMPGVHPRLFIDMIGFVEMGRDRRVYRFVQDRRHGRTTIAESQHIDTIVDAVTDYIALRLVEREKALASDAGPPPARRRDAVNPNTRRPFWQVMLGLVIDCLGSVVLIGLIGVGCVLGYRALTAWLGR